MKKINHALIMAAGRGLRMMPFTEQIPKAMAPLAGSTLIANGIMKILKHIDNVHITVGYKGAMLAKHVIENNVSSILNTEGKGNAWWIFNTLLKNINEPIVVLTCDNVIELDFDNLLKDYINLGEPCCMVVPVKPLEGLTGDYITHDNQKVTELSREKETDIYCSGIQVLNPFKLNQLVDQADSFYKVWNKLIEQEQLYCSTIYPEKWYAVDTMEQLVAINKIQEKHQGKGF